MNDFLKGFEKAASTADNLYHAAELGGLGMLAYPSIKHLAGGKDMKEKNYHKLEAAGLGVLAAPSAIHLGRKLLTRGK